MSNASTLAQGAPLPKTAPTPPPAPSTGPSPYNWGQITAGPAAVAFPAIMKLMEVMTELMIMYQQQNATQVAVQAAAAKAGAACTIAAANDQASQTFMQAGTEFASVGTSLLQMKMTSSFSAPSNAKLETASENNSALTSFAKSYQTSKPATIEVGEGTPPLPPKTPLVEARMQELKTANQDSVLEIAKKGTETVTGNPGDQNLNEAALAHLQAEYPDEFKALNEKISRTQDDVSRAINNANIGLQSAQNTSQMITTAINGAVSGALTAGQTHFQKDQGVQQAAASLAQSNAQTAGTMASNSQGFIGQFYQEEMQALQMLQQLSANSRV